jgi:hypothetical protein
MTFFLLQEKHSRDKRNAGSNCKICDGAREPGDQGTGRIPKTGGKLSGNTSKTSGKLSGDGVYLRTGRRLDPLRPLKKYSGRIRADWEKINLGCADDPGTDPGLFF